MEAASRPPLELLPDLPVEEPLDSAQRAARPPEPPVLPAAPGAAADSKDPVQTSIQFLDPAALLLATAEVPALSAAPAPAKSDPAPGEPAAAAAKAAPKSAPAPQAPELELLEDPAVVEELLTSPPPPPPAPKPLPAEPAPTLTPAAPPQASSGASAAPKESAPRLEARVPIARTASLSSAAHKVAAASKRAAEKPAAPAPLAPAPRPAAPAPVAKAKADAGPPAGAPGSAAENLAGWTSARAAAAPVKGKAPAPVAPAAPAPRPAPPKPAAAKPAPPPPAAATTGGAPLDRDSIARNQIVERYLSGRLPLKGATEFEQFCGRHPEILDELGLPERVNAALRLLEAAGKPEPWQEAQRPAWQKPQVTLALAVAAVVLAMSLAVVSGTVASKSHRVAELQKQVSERPLDPATSTREIRLVPSRSGASNSPAITIGGAAGGAQLADFKIDESRSPYHIYRITIDRIDQGRVAVITNLVKDSNGHLRVALNSSALGPGNYQLTIEGMNWRGDPEPDSWITIGIARPAN